MKIALSLLTLFMIGATLEGRKSAAKAVQRPNNQKGCGCQGKPSTPASNDTNKPAAGK